jgi:predicted ATP-binding protein involved in virulence
MRIIKYRLSNFGRFKKIEIELAQHEQGNVTVFIGNNGAGKTSLLKGLATGLSWLVARIRSEKGSGSPISDSDISNGQAYAQIHLTVQEYKKEETANPEIDEGSFIYDWTLNKTRKGHMSKQPSSLDGVTRLADYYRQRLTHNENTSLPLIAYYPVERVVLDIPLKIKTKHSFGQLDGYDNALLLGVDFRRFFEWFREREDVENESGLPEAVIRQLLDSLEDKMREEIWQKLSDLDVTKRDKQLMAIRTAISAFMPGFSNLRVQRRPKLAMLIDKDRQTLDVAQLSQGEKSLLALVGDLARRLAMMNPALENPLQGEGLILIDEIDLHLHPKWQRSIISRLRATFPNCQFVLSTHSPLVISDPETLLCYALEDGGFRKLGKLYGMDANQVLLQEMDADVRNPDIDKKLGNLLDSIQDGQVDAAKNQLAELEKLLPIDHLELNKARLLLKKLEIRRAQNH